ncbi:MAG TPA: hypothetical protein VM802_08940 [Chitinophaga sp.]|uniref:alpha/beta hydrolase family protein n=1 Tax=Chitinophaga sp. TaxID=1869181 RepID=UPI002CAEFC89|nr:hypothetical protein [Chitinophaga sp.]HVI44984.1 hypothetical protein [Chitinophaga sp.]
MRACFLFLLLTFGQIVCGQPTRPGDYGLKAYTIHDKELGDIHFYITVSGIDKTKPVLLSLDGSGHIPLATYAKLKKSVFIANSFDNDVLELRDKFHVVMISKPGIPFCDTVRIERDSASVSDAISLLPVPREYKERSGLQWRAAAASRVIDYVCAHLPVDRSRIIAYGYSEGAQVAPRLAVINKKITHCASIAGSGLNQLYDWITAVRIRAAQGLISQPDAQHEVDSLFAVFSRIYAAPNDTEHEWEDNTYQRWASFCTDIPLSNLVQLNIPIFMAAGTRDDNSPIYSQEYVRLEFLRLGKKNLTFKTYPTDHFFNEIVKKDGTETVISHKQEMMQDLLKWLEKTQ